MSISVISGFINAYGRWDVKSVDRRVHRAPGSQWYPIHTGPCALRRCKPRNDAISPSRLRYRREGWEYPLCRSIIISWPAGLTSKISRIIRGMYVYIQACMYIWTHCQCRIIPHTRIYNITIVTKIVLKQLMLLVMAVHRSDEKWHACWMQNARNHSKKSRPITGRHAWRRSPVTTGINAAWWMNNLECYVNKHDKGVGTPM